MTVQKLHENLFFLILAWVWEIKHSLSIHLKGWRKKDINLYPWNSLFFCLQTSYHIRNWDLHLLSANNVFQYLKKQNQNYPMHSWYPLFGFSKSHKIIMLIFSHFTPSNWKITTGRVNFRELEILSQIINYTLFHCTLHITTAQLTQLQGGKSCVPIPEWTTNHGLKNIVATVV